MNNIQKLAHLESSLEGLKQSLKTDAVYSEEKLQQLQINASDLHNRTEQFYCLGARDMASTLSQKLSEGYTYKDHIAAVLQYQSGSIHLTLNRPDDIVESELSVLAIKTKDNYMQDIVNAKNRLINEIAEINLQIKQVKKEIAAETKYESDYAKEVERVQKELLGSTHINNIEEQNVNNKDQTNDI